jgi:hypothetical protein
MARSFPSSFVILVSSFARRIPPAEMLMFRDFRNY